MSASVLRTRWAAIGAALAVSLGAGGIGISQASTSSGERPIYVPIEPCRLADTRPAFQVGPRTAPLGPAENYTLSGWGSVGDCTLPTGTTGLSLNVTAVDPTQPTFLTLYPAASARPNASHLNPTPGQPPTPNAVNVDLDAGGEFNTYNLQGNVHVIIDVVGYYDHHTHNDLYYTETEVDAAIAPKANSTDVYTKSETALGMFARVAANGTLIAGTPGATAEKASLSGRYLVRFPRDVTECALVAQNNKNESDVASELVYLYTTTLRDPNDVFVYFEDEAGIAEDREFSVIVMC